MQLFEFCSRPARYKVLSLSPELILQAVLWRQHIKELVEIEGLPPGAEIQSVIYDDYSRTFKFRLWHSEFEEVTMGERLPELTVMCRVVNNKEV